MSGENNTSKENQQVSPQCFDVISSQQVNQYKDQLQKQFGIDISAFKVNILQPEDDLYVKEEIKFRYFQSLSDESVPEGEIIDLLGKYESNPANVPISELKAATTRQGLVLEGRLPGFAAVSNGEMNFFAVNLDDAIDMANRYAQKEGELNRTFTTPLEAKAYLQSLGEEAFLHEVGHLVYGKITPEKITAWETSIIQNNMLRQRVISIQEDKYPDISQIPVAEEAFADIFVSIAGEGKSKSRLEVDQAILRHATTMIKQE